MPEPASRAELRAFRTLAGSVTSASTSTSGTRGRYTEYRVHLTGSAGLSATGLLLRPERGTGPWPAVLLDDGRELNSRAVDYLPPEFGNVVVLALDYPPQFPHTLTFSTLLAHSRQLRAVARRVPALFILGGEYLAHRPDVDSTRVAIAATSFAVPFAVIAAASDSIFRNVALIYGAGGLAHVIAANLSLHPAFLRSIVARLAVQPFTKLEPERYVGGIAPRPIVMVNGVDDPQMPRAAVESLYSAARQPKALIWLRTGHLMPTDTALIRALVHTALARLPVLRAGDSVGAASR